MRIELRRLQPDQSLKYTIQMRIAYDHQIFSMQPWGGISRYFVRLAEELHSVGENVSVMAHYHRNHHLEEVQKALVNGTSVTTWPYRLGRLAKKLNAPLVSRSLRRWPPDILHETYYQGIARSSLKAPVVITVHDMIHEVMPEAFRTNDRTSARKREAVSRADHVICISEHTRKDLLEFFEVPPSKTSVVYHGIDGPAQAITTQHSVPENSQPPFVLYVGKRGGYKNFQLILRAFAESPVLRGDFEIVCFGGGAFNAEELSLVASLGLRKDQLRYESGNDDKLSRLYSSASVFVHSSKYEGFGLPPVEAMAHGCPVVSSNASCMPEVLGNAAQFFNPESCEELRHALELVVSSAESREQLRDSGFKRCAELTWSHCAENTLSVYNSVLENHTA